MLVVSCSERYQGFVLSLALISAQMFGGPAIFGARLLRPGASAEELEG